LYFYGRLSEMTDAEIRKREAELFELVSLSGRQHEAVRRYSKGMRQRLGLAQAMLHDPDLLILDEPTDGLDPMGRSQIRDVLDRLKKRGKTVFLNSHILQEVELICDRVAIMALGQLRAIGTIDELVRQHTDDSRSSLKIEVIGNTQSIERILAEVPNLPTAVPHSVSPIVTEGGPEALTRIGIASIDQPGADAVVDCLRSHQISILRLERARPSLEQVFMNMVNTANGDAASRDPYPSR
jgi:ABC-2 type transport system ATP-binding protein